MRNRRVLQYLHTASRRIIERHGGGRDRHADHRQEPVLEARGRAREEAQARSLCRSRMPASPELLTYKAELVGIRVVLTEESYTSQASFLDRDPLPSYASLTGSVPALQWEAERSLVSCQRQPPDPQ